MAYDIFISYSHRDNLVREGKRYGWVDRFHIALRQNLAEFLGREPNIFRDTKIDGYKRLTPAVYDSLEKSLLLIPILSPNFLTSKWCPDELKHFCGKNMERPDGLAQVFPVVKTPIDKVPDELTDNLLKYQFFLQDGFGDDVVLFNPDLGENFESQFYLKTSDLARNIAKYIKSLPLDITSPIPSPAGARGGETPAKKAEVPEVPETPAQQIETTAAAPPAVSPGLEKTSPVQPDPEAKKGSENVRDESAPAIALPPSTSPSTPPAGVKTKLPLLIGGAAVLALVLIIFSAIWLWNTPGKPRELSYFLNVQKMRGGQPFEAPFKSSGQEVFENGYKFKMFFQADANGFMYIFNETKDASGQTIYYILYPTPKTNSGLAGVAANQQIETGTNTFKENPGIEVVWLIWTAQKQDFLEDLRQAAFAADQGAIKDGEKVQKFNDFLGKYKNDETESRKDSATQQTMITGKGDVIVRRIELEHR